MTSNQASSGSLNAARKRALWGLSLVLVIAVALPEELPAAPMVSPIVEMTSMQLKFARPDMPAGEPLLIHCCHAHPLPPYDAYCCHAGGAVVVAPGYGYGAAGVRGQSRRVSRRTSRRVSRRR